MEKKKGVTPKIADGAAMIKNKLSIVFLKPLNFLSLARLRRLLVSNRRGSRNNRVF